MTKQWLIDTDILIDYLRGMPDAAKFFEKIIENSICSLSTITLAELYSGVKEGKEKHTLENFLNVFHIIPVTLEIAKAGGLYRRDYGKSHGVGLADAMIAATAEFCNARLVSLNKKHFPMLKNVLVPYSK